MKMLIKCILFGLAIWGCFNIRWNDSTLADRAKDYIAERDITLSTMSFEKMKSLFPSWTQQKYQIFVQRAKN